MMKTACEPALKPKTFCSSKSYIPLKEKHHCVVDSKFYQKLFVVLIAMSTILIFSESPRDLEKICVDNNSRELCNVW